MPSDTLIYSLIIAALVLMSAYFSATETAFSSLNRTRLKALAEKGSRKAVLALRLSGQYDKLLSTILIGNNIVNIAMASLGTVLFIRLYGDIGATISTIVITIVVLIFGEISPKSIAKDCPERFAMFSAPFLRILIYILTPVNFLFTLWKKLLSKLLRLEANTKMSQEELLMLVEEVQQDGSIDQNEGELLRNAIGFSDRCAEDILTHRVDLEGVPLDAGKEEIARAFTQSRYSRLLVYDETMDDVVGVIHQKDFYTGAGITGKAVKEIITPVVFVLKNEKIPPILRQLQKNKAHVAVVLDEYGGTFGIVTMEDILEELVGEIWDEHDEVTEDFMALDSNTYRVDGAVDLEDFCNFFQVEADSEMSSLGGWVTEQFGTIPQQGASFEYGNLTITIVALEHHRVAQVDVLRRSGEARGTEPQTQEQSPA